MILKADFHFIIFERKMRENKNLSYIPCKSKFEFNSIFFNSTFHHFAWKPALTENKSFYNQER